MRILLTVITFAVFLLSHCASIPMKGEIHHPVTLDDWPLTIEHFPATSHSAKQKFPVLICHGLMANREYFKAQNQESLIAHLQRAGYDVWLMDLRGRDEAGAPGYWFGKHTYTYSMDDYIKADLDTAIKFVLEKTGASKINYIGHSMGGIIMHARLGSYAESRVANFVAVASPMHFIPLNQWMFTAYRMRNAMAILPVLPASSSASFASYLPFFSKNPLIRAVINPENTSPEILNLLSRRAINNIAKNEIRQFIYATENGAIYSFEQKINYRENLKNISLPILLLAGRRDDLADPATVRDVFDRVGSKDKTMLIFSRADGHADDYGHTDLVVGKKAHIEVHPRIIEWLDKRN